MSDDMKCCVDLNTGECLGDCQGFGDCPICQEFWGHIKSYTNEDMIKWGHNHIASSKKAKEIMDEFFATDEGKEFSKKIVEMVRNSRGE